MAIPPPGHHNQDARHDRWRRPVLVVGIVLCFLIAAPDLQRVLSREDLQAANSVSYLIHGLVALAASFLVYTRLARARLMFRQPDRHLRRRFRLIALAIWLLSGFAFGSFALAGVNVLFAAWSK